MNKFAYMIVFPFIMYMSFSAHSTPSLSSSEANAVLKQVKALHQEAVSKEGGWVITEKYMKKVKKLLASGKKEQALDAAIRARELAEASIKQAESQKKDWSEPPYIK